MGHGLELKDGIWAKQRAFVCAGGPSLKRFDWTVLQSEPNVIAVNGSILHLPNAAAWITQDVTAVRTFRNELLAFKGLKVFHAAGQHLFDAAKREVPDLVYIPMVEKSVMQWSDSFAKGMVTLSNSGASAIQLAHILGADPILLLGFDLNPINQGDNPNFHDRYSEDLRSGNAQLQSFRSELENYVAPKVSDRRVLNLNENSALTCWLKGEVFLEAGGRYIIWAQHFGNTTAIKFTMLEEFK